MQEGRGSTPLALPGLGCWVHGGPRARLNTHERARALRPAAKPLARPSPSTPPLGFGERWFPGAHTGACANLCMLERGGGQASGSRRFPGCPLAGPQFPHL